MDNPLNPTLYNLLKSRFGDVGISSPGAAISWEVSRPANLFADRDSRPSRHVFSQGEEYLVCCPFCRDWKKRLTINHMWGVWDEETNSQNLWLCQCYNESCTTDFFRQMQLFTMVWDNHSNRNVKIIEGVEADDTELPEAEPPGELIRLDELAEVEPDHHALRYLESRGFSPAKMGRLYGAAYCGDSELPLARDRIVIPSFELGVMCGWQTRYIGDSYGSQTLKEARIPKYWTMPGMKRKIVGYNMDRAVRYQTIAVVEGPMDVWGFGPQAFGLWGKSISRELVQKLDRWLNLYWGDNTTILVILDPDQDEGSARRHDQHHIEKCVDELRNNLRTRYRDRILPIYLPPGTDPGSLDQEFMRRYVKKKAAEAGLPVSFGDKARKPAVDAETMSTAWRGPVASRKGGSKELAKVGLRLTL